MADKDFDEENKEAQQTLDELTVMADNADREFSDADIQEKYEASGDENEAVSLQTVHTGDFQTEREILAGMVQRGEISIDESKRVISALQEDPSFSLDSIDDLVVQYRQSNGEENNDTHGPIGYSGDTGLEQRGSDGGNIGETTPEGGSNGDGVGHGHEVRGRTDFRETGGEIRVPSEGADGTGTTGTSGAGGQGTAVGEGQGGSDIDGAGAGNAQADDTQDGERRPATSTTTGTTTGTTGDQVNGNDTGTSGTDSNSGDSDTTNDDAGHNSGSNHGQTGNDNGHSGNGSDDPTDSDGSGSGTDGNAGLTTTVTTRTYSETETGERVLYNTSTRTVSTRENDLENNREVVATDTTTTNYYKTPKTSTEYEVVVTTITDADGNVISTTESEPVVVGIDVAYVDHNYEEQVTTETAYEEPTITVEYVTTTDVVRGVEVMTKSVYADEQSTENDLDTNREVTTTERTYTDTYTTEVTTTITTTPVYTITYSNGVTETENGNPTAESEVTTETRESEHVDTFTTFEDATVTVEYVQNVDVSVADPVIDTQSEKYVEREIDYENDRETLTTFEDRTTTATVTTTTTTTTTPVYTVTYPDGTTETEYGNPVVDVTSNDNITVDNSVEVINTGYDYPEIFITEETTTTTETSDPELTTTYEDVTVNVANEDGTYTELTTREYTDTSTIITTTIETTVPTTTLTYSDDSTETVVGEPIVTIHTHDTDYVTHRDEVIDQDTTPFADVDNFAGMEDQITQFYLDDILENDYDIDGDVLDLVSFEQPDNGTLTYNADEQLFTFTPGTDWNGKTSFGYTLTDGDDEVSSTVNLTIEDDLTDEGEENYVDVNDSGSGSGHGSGSGSGSGSGHGSGFGSGSGHGSGFGSGSGSGHGKDKDKDKDKDKQQGKDDDDKESGHGKGGSKSGSGSGKGSGDGKDSGVGKNDESAGDDSQEAETEFVFGLEKNGDVVNDWVTADIPSEPSEPTDWVDGDDGNKGKGNDKPDDWVGGNTKVDVPDDLNDYANDYNW